jgi:type 1 fimbria pilin
LKLILRWLIPLVFGIISIESRAAHCTPQHQSGAFNLPAINVPANVHQGTFLSGWIETSLRTSQTQCVRDNPSSTNYVEVEKPGPASFAFSVVEGGITYSVFSSPVAGIGFIVRGRGSRGTYVPLINGGFIELYSSSRLNSSLVFQFAIRLVATGWAVPTAGAIPSFIAVTSGMWEHGAPGAGSYTYFNEFSNWSTASGSVTTQTCSIVNRDLTFPLPSIRERDLPNVGSTGGGVSQNLKLNCPAGTNLRMVITDKTAPANRSSTLTLAADSGASGFGIEILYNGVPIFFGPDSASAGTQNQFSLGNNLNGTVSIPLTARYIRTAVQIKSGSVRALATYTMSYQ